MNARSLLASALVVVSALPLGLACSSSTEPTDGGTADAAASTTATATGTGTAPPVPADGGGSGSTLSALQGSIFTPSCAKARCHSGSRPSGGLSLEAGSTHGALVGVASDVNRGATRVVAGDPGQSLLVQVLKGSVGNVGRMPDGAAALSADQIAAVEAWVSAGAKDD